MNDKNILITGSAGFIGAALTERILNSGFKGKIVGIDNVNDYYDISLKEYRIGLVNKTAEENPDASFEFVRGDISDRDTVERIFKEAEPDIVINLAAQAGVRYSIENPDAYMSSNITGFYNILEACRHSYDEGRNLVEHLVFASSSSVYGGNKKVPFSEDDMVDHPVSLYAATKKSNELLAHSYSKLYGIPCTGLRFFTVYGPAGRPGPRA